MNEDRKPDPAPRWKVGYASPPVETRWKKGRPSPNPHGRPKKDKRPQSMPSSPDPHLHLTVLEEGNRLVTVHENGVREEIPAIVAIVRQLRVSANKGDVRAQLKFIELYNAGEQQRLKDKLALVGAMLDYKNKWAVEFARYDAAGTTRPDIIPHPDDCVIDFTTGEVIINGPRDAAEKAVWNAEFRRRKANETMIDRLSADLARRPKDRRKIEAEISKLQGSMDLVDRTYPAEEVRRAPGFNLEEWRKADWR